jgi:peroxiredoxin family protein
VAAEPLGILLLAGTHDRAHYAFVLASGAAALGRRVVLFASNAGCRALLSDWSELEDAARDARIVANGVAGFATLREAAVELGVRLIACEAASDWCQMQVGEYRGYLKRDEFWGALPKEAIND